MTKLGQILLTIWRITRLFLKGVSLLSYKCSYSIILSRIFFPPPGCSSWLFTSPCPRRQQM